jgi:pteridine reductase
MAANRLQGKLVVVTGGARGLGRALVESFAERGADVAFSYHGGGAAAGEVRSRVQATGRRAFAHAANAREPGQMAAFVEAAALDLGGLDVLVNNAGVFRRTPLGTLDDELLDEAFDINVKAAVLASQAAAPHLRRRSGAIVNIASLGGRRAWAKHIPYCASKAALLMATRCLALALAPEVRVNAVAPGVLDPPGASEEIRGRIPQRRFGQQHEVVDAVMYLACQATYTTGEVLGLDGGRAL